MATWVSRIEQGFRNLVGFQPCLPQCGPYEASEGIYPVRGKEKTGGGHPLKGTHQEKKVLRMEAAWSCGLPRRFLFRFYKRACYLRPYPFAEISFDYEQPFTLLHQAPIRIKVFQKVVPFGSDPQPRSDVLFVSEEAVGHLDPCLAKRDPENLRFHPVSK